MKSAPISKPFPVNPNEITAAIERAPDSAGESESAYDPNDAAAVSEFWQGATLRRPGQRGPGKKPKRVLLSVRYSPDVVAYFKSTGDGWQSRMDEALREWIESRKSA